MAEKKSYKFNKQQKSEVAESALHSGPWRTILGAATIVLITLAAYYPLRLAGYLYDDYVWLVGNPLIRSWSGLVYVWVRHIDLTQYYPMVFVVFDLAYHLWDLTALGYHFMNVLFQAANALLLWILLGRLGFKSAWLAAVIFAIHPVQVETVGWVVEMKNLLSAFFYFLTLLTYLRFAGLTDKPTLKKKPPVYRNYPLYVLALVLYILALFSKTDTCTLPAIVLLLIWWKRERWSAQDFLWTVPMFVLGAVLALVTIHIEHTTTGIQGPDWQFTFSQKIVIAGKALWFYASKFFWPSTLLPIYPRWPVEQLGGWEWIFPISFAAVAASLWLLQKKIGRGPFTALAFFGITLLPVLGFIPYYTMLFSFVADHFQYLACIGLIVPTTELIWYMSLQVPARAGELYSLVSGVVILALGSLTFGQSLLYQSPLAFWQYAHDNNNHSFYVTSIYGASLLDAGFIGPALEELQLANQMRPGYRATESALGMAYLDVKKYALAENYFLLAMREDPYTTYNLDGAVECLLAQHEYSRAIEVLQLGLYYNKDYAPGWISLARLYELTGHHTQALECYLNAVSLDPRYKGASLIIGLPSTSAPAVNER
ncbi:MAG TPA: hypothetical protein VMG59_07135 [Phycisphaerae bacterium]|nr:hypothetical protein [Phycisphaerae bacterium]